MDRSAPSGASQLTSFARKALFMFSLSGFEGEEESVFWGSGDGEGPFSGFGGRGGGPSSYVWGITIR